jgi:hypothetical protein
MTGLFEESVRSIAGAYQELGHTRGWRFLTVPRMVLTAQPEGKRLLCTLLTCEADSVSTSEPDH